MKNKRPAYIKLALLCLVVSTGTGSWGLTRQIEILPVYSPVF